MSVDPMARIDMPDHIGSMGQSFDIETFQDPGIRAQYQSLMKRFKSIARSVEATYKLDDRMIVPEFYRADAFNACVERHPGRYRISIALPAPVLLMIFFDKLLGNPSVMSWLRSDIEREVAYSIPFSIRAQDLTHTSDWSISTSKIRAFAAYTLSDIATTFIFMHEIGHILCGHLENSRMSDGQNMIAEFEFTDDQKIDHDLAQLREYEADAVAGSLITHYVLELIDDISVNPRTREAFGPDSMAAEQCTSLCIMALYGMFAYLRGAQRRLRTSSSHPDPRVRSFYVRDIVCQAMMAEKSMDQELLLDLLEARFEEFNTELVKLGLLRDNAYSPDNLVAIQESIKRLQDLKVKHRSTSEKFSFIGWM